MAPGLVLIIQHHVGLEKTSPNSDTHTAENLAFFIVRNGRQDIQYGGVGPALVNLENKEISSGDITVVSVTAHTL